MTDPTSSSLAVRSSQLHPPATILDHLSRARRPVLLTHIYPDGDGVGSQLGLALALRERGADPRILNVHPAPEKLRFVDPDGEISVVGEALDEATVESLARSDLHVVLDTSDPARLGHLQTPIFRGGVPRLCIDHHLCEHGSSFQALWSEPTSPSTGNMVLRVIQELGIPISDEIAVPLFVAVATDTGWFRFGNATPEASWAASVLVASGAVPEIIYQRIYETSSLSRTRLLGEVLAGLRAEADGRIIYGVLTADMLRRQAVGYEEIDGFIDMLKTIQGGEILFLAVELSPGRYKVSLRSKGLRDVHPIAAALGGGGHAKAAGCRLEGDESDVVERVLTLARARLGS